MSILIGFIWSLGKVAMFVGINEIAYKTILFFKGDAE